MAQQMSDMLQLVVELTYTQLRRNESTKVAPYCQVECWHHDDKLKHIGHWLSHSCSIEGDANDVA